MNDKEKFKKEILQLIKDRLDILKETRHPRICVDRIDEVELKELYNKILKL